MTNRDQTRPKVTIEDLLRVKRAERPPAEFWVRFEQELRAKQLAAIVAKRPWWHAVTRTSSGTTRWQLPLGAAAALAAAFFTVREYRRPAAGGEFADRAVASMAAPVAPAAPAVAAVLAPAAVAPVAHPAVADRIVPSNVRPGEIAQVISMLGTDNHQDDTLRVSLPSARLTLGNLAMAQMSEPEFAVTLVGTHGFEARALPARSIASEPLAQLSTPRYRSSARYLDTALSESYPAKPAPAVAPAADDHADQDRYGDLPLRSDEVSRIDAWGDRLMIKL